MLSVLMIRDAARDFANTELLPGVIERDNTQTFPDELVRKMGELGFMGIMVDPKYGGRNLLNEKDFFMKSQIPMTTLLMKQGMGRLIRNFSDKGVAILGDNRIQKKYYGKQILKSLPPFQLVEDYNQVLNFIEELR